MTPDPIHVGIRYPADIKTTREANGDITLEFRGEDKNRLTVLLSDTQARRLFDVENMAAPTAGAKEAAALYASGRIDVAEFERRIADELRKEGE